MRLLLLAVLMLPACAEMRARQAINYQTSEQCILDMAALVTVPQSGVLPFDLWSD